MTTTPTRPRWTRTTQPAPRRIPITPHHLLTLTALTTYTLCTTLRYHRYGTYSYDLAIFTEAIKQYAHLHTPQVPIKGEHFNILGDHFSPITATLAPAWWAWPSPITLLIAQAALFAWSVHTITTTTARHLGNTRGLHIGTAYALSFGILRAIDADFHEIAFAVPILAIVCRHLLDQRWTRATWWALPLLLVKEDLGLTVAAIGVYIAIRGRRWLTGAALAAAGIAATAAIVWWVIPHFNPDHHFAYWAPTGQHHGWWHNAGQAISRIQTWKTIGWTAGITGFLALRSPLALLAVPTITWRMLSSNPAHWTPDWHYSAVLMPIMFLAAVDAARRLGLDRRDILRTWADRTVTALPAVALACMASMAYGPGDLARKDAWDGGTVAAARTDALATIPDGVTVEATKSVLAPLAARTDAYWYGGLKSRPPQYVVFDRNDWADAPEGKDAGQLAADEHQGWYTVVFHRGGVTVVKLVGP